MSRIAAIRAAASGALATVSAEETLTPLSDASDHCKPKPAASMPKKDMPMTEEEMKAAISAAETKAASDAAQAATKAAHDRMTAVFASEHYAGREAMAAKLLGKAAMSAEDIIDVLASTPKTETTALTPEQQKAASEEAARKEMQAAIGSQSNSNVDADAPKPDQAAKEQAGWTKATAKINKLNGF
jgi:hypothetical protein